MLVMLDLLRLLDFLYAKTSNIYPFSHPRPNSSQFLECERSHINIHIYFYPMPSMLLTWKRSMSIPPVIPWAQMPLLEAYRGRGDPVF